MKKLLLFLLFFMLLPNLTFSQNHYLHEGSIGKQNIKPEIIKKDIFPFRPISTWLGERFIFMPSTKSSQKFGYQSFKGGDGKYGQPSYNKYVGRIAKVISVIKRGSLWDVRFEMEDNGHRLVATAYSESIHGVAPIADIDSARTKLMGKTFWYVGNQISTYNESTGKFGNLKVKNYSPIKIVDVVVGWFSHCPVRLILQTSSGEEGFKDINLSGTNVSNTLRDLYKFKDSFITYDPRIKHKWSNRIWSAIEEGNVFVGMTKEQAQMSWGKPKTINRTVNRNITNEQWVYKNGNYLYFEHSILTSIQN